MQQVNLDVDIDINPDVEGITADFYIGQNDSPTASQSADWETITDSAFSMHCLLSGSLVYDPPNAEEGVDEILNTAQAMIDAGERLKERVYDSKIFLRDKWLEDDSPESPADKEKYSVSYGDYCQHRLILEGHI
tara:strand:+ start:160 stop:561 length:402 start_codon:yes stop_codon:yes gene_type:complete